MRIGASLTSLAVSLLELRAISCLIKSVMRRIIGRNIDIRNDRLGHFLFVLKKSIKWLFDLKIVLTGIFISWALQNRRSRFILSIRNNRVNNIHLVRKISQINYRRWLNIYFFVINFTSIIVSKLLLRVNKISPLSASLIPGSAAVLALFAGRRPTLTVPFLFSLLNRLLVVLGWTIKRWLIVRQKEALKRSQHWFGWNGFNGSNLSELKLIRFIHGNTNWNIK